MQKELVWKYTTLLGACLMLQLILVSSVFAYCVHREGATIEFPSGDDTWVEECCDGRPSHWPASAMPIPVYIYNDTPEEFITAIHDAIDSWNNIESSFFQLQYSGLVGSKSHVSGAVVLGFDPDHCADDNDCGLAGTACDAASVNSSWDGYQIQWCTIFADANAHDWDEPGGPGSQRVMTHELGHVLGIMHPGFNPHGRGGAGCGPEFDGATMACCGGQIEASSLELDDMASATSLYPNWKFTVEVVDSSNVPIANAAVWMDNTCFPHEGEDRFEGGMVFGDIEFCLTGDAEPSNTYYPNFTYITESNGQTGEFRVMHSEFCFTVVADGYVDLYGCVNLPAPGNYITTVTMNMPPVCDANGPYSAECQGTTMNVTLNGTGSSDPDPGDSLFYSWTTDCPGGSFNNLASSTPILSVNTSAGSLICNGSLMVTDSVGASGSCSSTVTIQDTLPPSITCPSNITIECDQFPDPAITGAASAADACDSGPAITFSDMVIPGTCPEESTITRTWTATDASANSSGCAQTIEVVDTTLPEIQCNALPTISPPDDPISFTATATDNCDEDPLIEITAYTCTFTTKEDKVINKDNSCKVSFEGDTLTIDSSGGIKNHISWTVQATDCKGNQTTHVCFTDVVRYKNP